MCLQTSMSSHFHPNYKKKNEIYFIIKEKNRISNKTQINRIAKPGRRYRRRKQANNGAIETFLPVIKKNEEKK